MSLIDKVAKAAIVTAENEEQKAKLDRKKRFLLSSTTKLDDIKAWVPRVVESLSKQNPDERTDGREGKKFECPVDYALLDGSNITIGNPFSPIGSAHEGSKQDVGEMIFNEILHHGRQTMDELEKHIAGIDKHLLQVVINSMRMDYYLKDYKEKGDIRENEKGLLTLELVDYRARKRKFKKELADRAGNPVKKRRLTAVKQVKDKKAAVKDKARKTDKGKKDKKSLKDSIPIHS